MLRQIIRIDEEKCNGCGLCAQACHEGAIQIINGKAKLTREDYCDGLGDCLPGCPTGAITFEQREAPAYDAAAVAASKILKASQGLKPDPSASPCLGVRPHTPEPAGERISQLNNWPTQIKLLPVRAPWMDGARLLVAADCAAFASATLHEDFMAGRVTINGCPKLDGVDYAEKLSLILGQNDIREIVVARMEVPCCGGLEMAVKRALQSIGKEIPLRVVVFSTGGALLEDRA